MHAAESQAAQHCILARSKCGLNPFDQDRGHDLLLCMQVDENWYLTTHIYPQAAPIIARLPLGGSGGYYVTLEVGRWALQDACGMAKSIVASLTWAGCVMQLLGFGLTPFVTEMQTLLLAVLFHPLNAQVSIMQCRVRSVSHPLPRAVGAPTRTGMADA